MRIESRYVEYSGGKKVVQGVWSSHMFKAPVGCMDVGISKEEALQRVELWKRVEKKQGCGNFEYRIVD